MYYFAPYTVSFKRAGDIFVPPQKDSEIIDWNLNNKNTIELAHWLDQEKFTGVLKAFCNREKFRGALLLYAGWCIGAVYACLGEPPVKRTHLALPALLSKMLENYSIQIQIYDLPEQIVLPFASAFIGQYMEPAYHADPIDQARFFVEHISGLPRHSLISMNTQKGLCLVFFYWGEISGYFLVEEQIYQQDHLFPFFYLEDQKNVSLHLSILSPEIKGVYGEQTRFGFPLNIG